MRQFILSFIACMVVCCLSAQERVIAWSNVTEHDVWGLEGAAYLDESGVPYVYVELPDADAYAVAVVAKERCSDAQVALLNQCTEACSDSLKLVPLRLTERHNLSYGVCFKPFIKEGGLYYRVLRVNLTRMSAATRSSELQSRLNASSYKSSSQLSHGRYVKVAVQQSGIYQITYEDMVAMGFKNPKAVGVYGYGGAMLDEDFSKPYMDDVPEVSLYVSKGEDGTFGPGDFVLFYGQGIDRWEYNASTDFFSHFRHVYSNAGYYFVTALEQETSPIPLSTESGSVSGSITSFTDYTVHERDLRNLINSGREYYGEEFLTQTAYTFTEAFPNLLPQQGKVRLDVAAKANRVTSFSLSMDDVEVGQLSLSSMLNAPHYEFAKTAQGIFNFVPQSTSVIKVNIGYEKSAATGWLNFYELNVKRALRKVSGSPLFFRTADYLGQGLYHRFEISDAHAALLVWDVTNPTAVVQQPVSLEGSVLHCVASTDAMREFVAVDPRGDHFLKPSVVGAIANQDLHGLEQCDMVIISPAQFMGEAERLANAHRAYDGLVVHVVNVEEVYNEYSSGMPDATAYRRLMKMFYDRAAQVGHLPSYLLLFGDGSFDNRKLLTSNATQPIYQLLTYQSTNSVYETKSYVSDDYFAFLDDNEGANIIIDKMDIGVGRFPVYSLDQAAAVVDKTLSYIENNDLGPWKNQVLFMADDGDNNTHVKDADSVANLFQLHNTDMLVRKLYLDAYKQDVSAAGERYPLVKNIFQNYIQSGILMVNYMGHGGWNGWANEQILYGEEIDNMFNVHLPLWVTATCDFTSYDDFKDTGGERLFRNPNGGAVALFTTTRTVYANPNFQLNCEFTNYLTGYKSPGVPNKLGDVIRLAKNARSNFGDSNRMNFSLIGDPALLLGAPRSHKVITDSVNGTPFLQERLDTLRALQVVTLKGRVVDSESLMLDAGFNGMVYLSVFDKEERVSTLDNDQPIESEKHPFTYRDRTNALFTGSALVVDGMFEISFMLPKDIRYNYGRGRFVYYAVDQTNQYEANGSTDAVIVGGESTDVDRETQGPSIQAYLNVPRFKSGDVVNNTPLFVAHLFDESGINTIGSGIGHDLTLKLNNDPLKEYVLNPYYESVTGNYKEGDVYYQFSTLPKGNYSLTFKAWDLQNNSSSVSFDFKVEDNLGIELYRVFVYPNPASSEAFIVYEHDRPNAKLELKALIYDLTGRLVWQSEQTAISGHSNMTTIRWDLTSNSGEAVDNGLYLVRLIVSSGNEVESSKSIKLMLNKQ